MDATILRSWRKEGGDTVTFDSDAHSPSAIAHLFTEAADMAQAYGFRPAKDPFGFWSRVGELEPAFKASELTYRLYTAPP
ncbi:PHP domain-containing protein [Streptosporangium soli]|nr:hypothetical protein [Streptosporangium sp. KLBMP 9127]